VLLGASDTILAVTSFGPNSNCAGVGYYFRIDKTNVDSAPIAVVGALGDLQDKYDQRMLGGMNERIVQEAISENALTAEKDLIFFGRETRPIHKALSSSTSPFIPGISGDESASVALLDHLGIKLRNGEGWRALRDLTMDEKKASAAL
jgi:RecJ-like exonuclease